VRQPAAVAVAVVVTVLVAATALAPPSVAAGVDGHGTAAPLGQTPDNETTDDGLADAGSTTDTTDDVTNGTEETVDATRDRTNETEETTDTTEAVEDTTENTTTETVSNSPKPVRYDANSGSTVARMTATTLATISAMIDRSTPRLSVPSAPASSSSYTPARAVA